jgi:hypothetical protein
VLDFRAQLRPDTKTVSRISYVRRTRAMHGAAFLLSALLLHKIPHLSQKEKPIFFKIASFCTHLPPGRPARLPHPPRFAARRAVFHKEAAFRWKTKPAAGSRRLGAAGWQVFCKSGFPAAFFARRDENFTILVFTFSSQLCNQIHEKTGYTGFTRKRSRNRLLAT